MTLLKSLSLLTLSAVCSLSYAAVGEASDTTTCYIFKKNKLVQKSECSYEADVGSSMTYAVNEYTYNVPKFGKIKTVDNLNDGVTNSKGEVTFKSETHTLNGKKSVTRTRNAKSFKIYSEKQLKANPSLRDDALECSALKDNSLEICTPPNNLG